MCFFLKKPSGAERRGLSGLSLVSVSKEKRREEKRSLRKYEAVAMTRTGKRR